MGAQSLSSDAEAADPVECQRWPGNGSSRARARDRERLDRWLGGLEGFSEGKSNNQTVSCRCVTATVNLSEYKEVPGTDQPVGLWESTSNGYTTNQVYR